MQHKKNRLLILSCFLALTACGEGSVGERIGIERKAPDEFRVLSRPPLSVPPEFNLRPPSDGSDYGELEVPASKTAESAVFGTNLNDGTAPTAVVPVESGAVGSQSDQNFLNRAGVAVANPDIKSIIRKENPVEAPEEKGFLQKLREPTTREPTVDATKEAERLKTNEATGKAIDDGETPTKLPKDRGIIDKIF